MHITDKQYKTYQAKFLKHGLPFIQRATTSIKAGRRGDIYPCGTGTLLAVGRSNFLITAAHVANALDKSAAFDAPDIYISDGGELADAVPFVNKTQFAKFDEPLDVAVIPLDENVVSKMPNRSFLTLDQVHLYQPSFDDWLYVYGFPGNRSTLLDEESIVTTGDIAVIGFRFDNPKKFNLNPSHNFVVTVDDSPFFIDINGVRGNLPIFPGGISGCGIWSVRNASSPLDDWSLKELKVCGVQLAVCESHIDERGNEHYLIIGATWGVVLSILVKSFPDTVSLIVKERPDIQAQLSKYIS